jgi:hypothetical protein
MRRLTFVIAVVATRAVLGALSQTKVYSIRAIDHSAQLMWDGNEMLLFIGARNHLQLLRWSL